MQEVPEELSKNFKMQRLSDFYYAWGAGAADFNHDGVLDVVAGPHIYWGPGYTTHREIYLQQATNPADEYTRDDWMQFVADFTGDGWADVLNCSFSGNPGCFLYVNPKGESRRWDKHLVIPAYQTEIGVLKDIDGDGKPELVYGAQGQMRYAKPDPANPDGDVGGPQRVGGRTVHRPRHRRRRHQRRRPAGHHQSVRLVGAPARGQQERAVGFPPAGVCPVRAHPHGRQRDGRLRRQRRRQERRGDGAGRARVGPGVVRAEARRPTGPSPSSST